MDIDMLRNNLRSVNINKPGNVNMKLVQKEGNGYEVYQPNLQKKMRLKLKKFYSSIIENIFYDQPQAEYNPNVLIADTIQCAPDTIAHVSEVIDEIESQENFHGDLDELDIEDISFYCIKFTVEIEDEEEDEDIYIFRRFTKMKKIRSGIFGMIQDNTFHTIEQEKFYGIDRDIDILVFRNEVLIINKFALQTVFKLHDYFNDKAEEALNYLNETNIMENFDQFKEDCLNDKLAARRITKILGTEGRLEGFVENISEIGTVIEEVGLDIQLNNQGQIIYTSDKETRSQILFCIADAYYRSILLRRIGEDSTQ